MKQDTFHWLIDWTPWDSAIVLLKILLSSSRGRANTKMLSSEHGKPLATIKISNDFSFYFF